MKKLIAIIFVLTIISTNANAGFFTFIQAADAADAANKAQNKIEENQKDIVRFNKKIDNLEDKLDYLIKLLEKEHENKENDNNCKGS